MVGENILEVFLAVPTVVGENILEFFLILGATGHGCSAEGTDAAPRAHGTGALQPRCVRVFLQLAKADACATES